MHMNDLFVSNIKTARPLPFEVIHYTLRDAFIIKEIDNVITKTYFRFKPVASFKT